MAGWTEGEARARCGLSQRHTSGLVTCHITPARPVQVKGWSMECGPSSGEYGVGHGCGQLYSMCFIMPHLVTCHVPPAHPVQVNNGVWSNT